MGWVHNVDILCSGTKLECCGSSYFSEFSVNLGNAISSQIPEFVLNE